MEDTRKTYRTARLVKTNGYGPQGHPLYLYTVLTKDPIKLK
jgi:hypothetical protein